MTEIEREREDAVNRAYEALGGEGIEALERAGLTVLSADFVERLEPLLEAVIQVKTKLEDGEDENEVLGEMLERVDELMGEEER